MTRRSQSAERNGNKPAKGDFLVSFLVDARGGSMTGSRQSRIRIVIPPRAASEPVRVTCRQLRPESVLHLPPLSDGECFGSQLLQLAPAQFLSPVLVELPHSTPVDSYREVVVYRYDPGRKWSLHTDSPTDKTLQQFLSSSLSNLSTENGKEEQIIQVTTTSLPLYLAVISRPRQQIHNLGPDGGLVTSGLCPGVQILFPARALTKPVSVGLSACPAKENLTADLSVQGGAVSPVITIEPRRRKFHKPITITIPIPQPIQGRALPTNTNIKGVQMKEDFPIEMSLLLLCSMSEAGVRAVWEDVTHSTPLSIAQGTVQFTTVVSASFWLVNLPTWMVTDSFSITDRLFRCMCRSPYLVRLSIFWRPEVSMEAENADGNMDRIEAEIRILITTESERSEAGTQTLEAREGFKPLSSSQDVIIWDKTEVDVRIKGNIARVQEVGRLLFRPFYENRTTVGVRRSQHGLPAAGVIELACPDLNNIVYSSNILLPIKKK